MSMLWCPLVNQEERVDPHVVGGRLQEILGARGITQAALAEAIGTSPAAVSNWLSGRKRPSTDNLQAIAAWLEVPLSVLLEGAQLPRDDARERAEYSALLKWYWRGAPRDEGRELGDPAAFAFEPNIPTFGRETGQNTLDERLPQEPTAWLDYSVIELSGTDLEDFLVALQFGKIRPHLEAAAESQQKVGNVIRAGLRALDEDGQLILIRVADYFTTGLTGPEYGRGRFTAVCRNTLDSQKGETAGGSFGLGKATMWATSAFGLVVTNSDLSVAEGDLRTDRFFARLELPWHELDESFAGPAWFGAPDETRGCTQSYGGNATLGHDLYVDRHGDAPGTSFLIVGAFDPSGAVEGIDGIAAELRKSAAENFWPAMVGRADSAPKLRVTVRTMRGHEQLSEHSVDPADHVAPLVDAVRRFSEGEVVDELQQPRDVVQKTVTLHVPERIADPPHGPTEQDVIVLIAQADEGDEPEPNHVYYFRGNSMIIRRPRLASLPLGARPFHAIVMAGEAASQAPDDHDAERFLRAAEPPAHNQWTSTPDVTSAYKRGGRANLDRMENDIREVIRNTIRGARSDESDGPDALRQLLRLVSPNGESPKRPRVKSIKGALNDENAWEIEAVVTIPPRSGGWRFAPVLQFAAESGPGYPVSWADLVPTTGCEVDGRYIRVADGVRSVGFRGVSDVSTHPVSATRAKVALDLREMKTEGDES
jgi:transcriptional regulator with XRE-family HTH domain